MRPKKLPISVSYTDEKEYQRQWRKLNPGIVRKRNWLNKYNLTALQYEEMFEAQKGKCAICETAHPGRGDSFFHVDHNHETGVVRGLLCNSCNMGIGYFKDNPEFLQKAINYLQSRK